jgi:hypothetical protein
MRWVLLAVVAVGFLPECALSAQSLGIALSPFSPEERSFRLNSIDVIPLGAYRFSAVGAQVQVDRVEFTVGGSGDFAEHLKPAEGLQLWLDDGDGKFVEARDTFLSRALGDTPTIRVTLHNPLVIAADETADIWVVGDFAKVYDDDSFERTYFVSIADPAHVEASTTVVLLDPPPLSTQTLTITWRPPPPCDCCSLSARGAGALARLPALLFAGLLLACAVRGWRRLT